MRHGLERLARFAPGGETADDYERIESLFPQLVRHPGAGRFARSSTVEKNVVVPRQDLQLFRQVVGLQADGALDAVRLCVRVAMTSACGNDCVGRLFRLK